HSEVFNYTVMAEDLAEYCSEHKLSSISLIGHSMGGKAAMFFAAAHPHIVAKLIVADIGTRYYKPHHQEIMAALNAVDFASVTDRNNVDEIIKTHVPDFGTRQFLMKSLYRKSATEFAFRFNLNVFNNQLDNIGEALPDNFGFDTDTLFIKGGKSRYILEQDYDDIQKQFPRAQFEIIPDAGHWLHAEKPDEFFDLCRNFLK
ncbi:MAG TPA: alpha/beta fold hydrolase, partial [Flavobacterium sp.]|nr:alpha/beta fold hydrolase [Flavobacterium sp.]